MTVSLLMLVLAGSSLSEPVSDRDSRASGAMPAAALPASSRAATLSWTSTVHLEIERAPDEIVVRFDRPLDPSSITKFAAAAGPDLADFRWNDISLVLRPAVGRRIDVAAGARTLDVTFLPDDEDGHELDKVDTEDAPKPAGSGLELALLRAQADAAAGYTGHARRSLASLQGQFPDEPQVQRALADAERADGALRSAARRYLSMGADDPFALQAISEANGSATSVLTIRGGKTFEQRETSLVQSEIPLRFGVSLGLGLRHVITRADFVAPAPGRVSDGKSPSTIADITASLDLGSAARLILQGSALLDDRSFGLGARLSFGSQERQARFGLSYRVPDVSTPEQSAYGGFISRAAIGATLRVTPEMLLQADLSWRGYGLNREGVLATTVTAAGGIDYLLRRNSPSLALAYRLDAEYLMSSKVRSGGAVIPLSDRENHTVQLVSSLPWRGIQFTGALGWTKDRLGGGKGPTASLSGLVRVGNAWNIEFNGGISSVSRPALPGRQRFLRVSLSRYLKVRR